MAANKKTQGSGSREKILAAALTLFSRRGYESAGVQEICLSAGITKPTLYYYFHSKRGLLDAILLDYGGRQREMFRTAAVYNRNLKANLEALFQGSVDFALAFPEFYRLEQSLFRCAPETEGFDAGRPLRADLTDILKNLFAAASGDHGNMRGRERVYAASFMGLLETWALLLANGELERTAELRARVIHHFMHGIFS